MDLTSAFEVLPVVLSQLQEVQDICVPGLQVHSERSLPLASTLVHISRGFLSTVLLPCVAGTA